jgi:hypothetical protein
MGLAVERQRVEIPYTPRRQFLPFHYRRQRWACMVAHRRAGKTVACINDLIKAALCSDLQDARYSYICPYYAQAKDVAWTYLKRFSAPMPGHSVNESELRIDYPNGARVRLYGADNYDRLRGGYLDGVVLDEYADMSPAAWGEVIRPMLADRKGWAVFIGTPKGRNAFWEIWELAQADPTYFALMLKASATGLVDAEELEAARRDMTPEQYAQEFECSFDAAILGAYYGREIAEAERDGRITVLPDTDLPVNTAWDLGMVKDSTAIWFWQVAPDGLRVLDYYENIGMKMDHYVDELRKRPYTYGDHWLPHDARVPSMETGRTRVEVLQSLGLKVRKVPQHSEINGINAARVSFKNMWFDRDKCRVGIEALRQFHAEFDPRTKAFQEHPKKDWTNHAADAFRYLAMAWKEMKPSQITKPKPTDLEYHVDEKGKLIMNMDIKGWVEMQKRKRLHG